jgi:hypothetical protein
MPVIRLRDSKTSLGRHGDFSDLSLEYRSKFRQSLESRLREPAASLNDATRLLRWSVRRSR